MNPPSDMDATDSDTIIVGPVNTSTTQTLTTAEMFTAFTYQP